jgi:sterol desaturase/sphingolipid hydroxylase (fatty acid hydroxylase superfamily)
MNEGMLRLGLFAFLLGGFALWEVLAPHRHAALPRTSRWPAHFGLSLINSLILRFILPFSALSTALFAQNSGYGLLNMQSLNGFFFIVPLALVLLDFAIYLQHILFHKIPWLWQFHAMHHSDTHMDVTTGIRFHPIEAIVSMVYKCALVLLLGAPPLAVIIFEVILNASSLFSHSNLSPPFERVLRFLFVTPQMHEVHHSPLRAETNSNYGFNLSVWDRLFKTYRVASIQKQFGLEDFRTPIEARLDKLLRQPFKK